MSIPRGLSPGDLIVFDQRSNFAGVYAEHNVARIDIVRERDFTVYPWRLGDRRWDKQRRRIGSGKVLAKLPADADVAAVAERLNVLRNQRDMERESANLRYRRRVSEKLVEFAATAVS